MRALVLLVFVLCGCAPAEPPPARPTDGGCFTFEPEEVDFGEVRTSSVQKLQVRNHANEILLLRVESFSNAFGAVPDGNPFLDPGGVGWLDVRFVPPDARLHLAELEIMGGERCRQRVAVRGLGTGRVQSNPPEVVFGGVDLGDSKVLEVTLTNTRRTPVTFDTVRIIDDQTIRAGFAAPFSMDATAPLELAPLESTTIRVTATPAYAFAFRGRLMLTGPEEQVSVRLTVSGGTPVAELSRTHIEVPIVEFTPVFTNRSFVERHLVVRNVGVPNGALSLRFQNPAIRVERGDGGIANEEFQVVVPSSGIAAGGQGTITLRFLPTEFGFQRFRVFLLTNEVEQPEHLVTFAATVWPVQQCTFRAPLEEIFTPVGDGGAEGEVIFTNEGTTPCVLDDVRLRDAGVGRFRVLDGGVEQLELAPGRSHVVRVAGARRGVTVTSELNFHHLYPNSVNQAVRLVIPP